MASSIDEFRKLLPKELTLPSGLIVEIRKVQQWDLIGGEELPMPGGSIAGQGTAETTLEQVRYMKSMTDRIILKGTVRPPLTNQIDDQGEPLRLPDKLHLSELTQEDYVALASGIKEWCGLTQEDGKAIEAFRSDTERSAGEIPSGAVPLPTL